MEQTVNLFQKGLLTDFHPLILSNDTLIDALNATITTLNGNEMILQNDMGNVRVEKAFLRPGYVPVGMKEYGGIIYVASYNPITNKSLIGSFPSPERDINGADDPNLGYLGFSFDNIISHSEVEALLNLDCVDNTEILLPLSKNNSLRAGDKFIAYTNDYFFSEIVGGLVKDTSEDYITNYNNIIYEKSAELFWIILRERINLAEEQIRDLREQIELAQTEHEIEILIEAIHNKELEIVEYFYEFISKYDDDNWFKEIRYLLNPKQSEYTLLESLDVAYIIYSNQERYHVQQRINNIINTNLKFIKIKTPKNKLYTLSLGILNSQNEFVDITKSLVRWNTKWIENKESIESAILDTSKLSDLLKFNYGYFMPVIDPNVNNPMEFDHLDAAFIENRQTVPANTYAYKLIGPLYLKVQLNHIETIRHNFYGEYNNGSGELIVESTVVYNCPDGITQSDWKPYTPDSSNIYSELEIPKEQRYSTTVEGVTIPTDLYYNILQEITNNNITSLRIITPTSVTIDKSIFTDNLYKIIITKTYNLGSGGITVNENIARFVIGVKSNFKYEDNNVDKDTYIEELSELKEIDVTKLNSGNLELKNWRFLNNWDEESADSNAEISMYLEAYPKKNHSFRNLRLDFYEAPSDSNYNFYEGYVVEATKSLIAGNGLLIPILPAQSDYEKYIKTSDGYLYINDSGHYEQMLNEFSLDIFSELSDTTYGLYSAKQVKFVTHLLLTKVGTLNIETDEIYSNTLISQSFNWESLNLKPRTVYYVDVIYDDFDANTLTSTDKHQDAWYLASNLLDECYYKDSENFILNFNDLTDNKLLSYLTQNVAIETSYSVDEDNEYHDNQLSTYSVFTNKYNDVKVEYHKKFLVNCHYDIGKQLLLKFPEGLNVNSGNYAPASFKIDEQDFSDFSASYLNFIENTIGGENSSEISGDISSQFKYEDTNTLSVKGFDLLVGGYFDMTLHVHGDSLYTSGGCPIAIESFSDFYNNYIKSADLDSQDKEKLFGISRNEGGVYLTRNDDFYDYTYDSSSHTEGEEIMIIEYTPLDRYINLNLERFQKIQEALSDGFSTLSLIFTPNKKLFMIGCAKGNIPLGILTPGILTPESYANSRLFRAWMKTGDKSEPQWALLASLWIENDSDIDAAINKLKTIISYFVSKYNFEYSFRPNVTSENLYYTQHKFIKAFKEYFKLKTEFKVTKNRNNPISETKSFLLKNRVITFTLNYNNFTENKSFDVEFKTSDYYNNRVEILNLINNGDTSILINSRGEVWDLDGNPLELNKIYNTCNVSILPKQFDTVDGVKIPLYSYKQESGSIKIYLTTSGSKSSDLIYNGNPVYDKMTVKDIGLKKYKLFKEYVLDTKNYPFYIVDAPFNPTW